MVTTVRSEDKAQRIRKAYPNKTPEELDVVIVPDIADPTAFDEVVKVPGLEVVMHTASPFHLKISEYLPKQLQPSCHTKSSGQRTPRRILSIPR